MTSERLQSCQDIESLALWLTVAKTSEISKNIKAIVQTTSRLLTTQIRTMGNGQVSESGHPAVEPRLRNQLDRLEERFIRDREFRESVMSWLQEKAEAAISK